MEDLALILDEQGFHNYALMNSCCPLLNYISKYLLENSWQPVIDEFGKMTTKFVRSLVMS